MDARVSHYAVTAQRNRFFTLLLISFGLVLASPASAVVIDDFEVTAQSVVADGSNTVVAPEAIGGFRSISLTKNGLHANAGVYPAPDGMYAQNAFAGTSTVGTLTWDGNGAGLGGVDLTEGLVNGRFLLVVDSVDVGLLDVTLTVDGVVHTVNGVGAGTLTIPFTSFPGVDFTSVDAISLTMVGGPSADFAIDLLETAGDPQVDLELAKAVSGGPYVVGDTVTFTLTVTNRGPSSATGVAVQDVVPDGYGGVGNISNGGTLSGNTITWSGLSIAAGTSVALTFDAVILASGNYANSAEVTAADQPDVDSTPGNGDPAEDDQGSASAPPVTQVDLELAMGGGAGPYQAGDTVTFTITVTNRGPGDATGVAVEDVVPGGFIGIANIGNGGTLSGNTITWSGLSIASGTSVTLTFDAVIQASGDHTNSAEVAAADQPDVDSTPGNGDPAEDDQGSFPVALGNGGVASIPTLSEWTLVLLSLLVAAAAFRRQRKI